MSNPQLSRDAIEKVGRIAGRREFGKDAGRVMAITIAAGPTSMVSGIRNSVFAASLAVVANLGATLGPVLGSGSGLAATPGMAGCFAGGV